MLQSHRHSNTEPNCQNLIDQFWITVSNQLLTALPHPSHRIFQAPSLGRSHRRGIPPTQISPPHAKAFHASGRPVDYSDSKLDPILPRIAAQTNIKIT